MVFRAVAVFFDEALWIFSERDMEDVLSGGVKGVGLAVVNLSGGRVCSDRMPRFLGGVSADCHNALPGRPGGRPLNE